MSSFTIGSGFNLTCKNKQVQEILEAFIDSPDNCVREYERNVVKDLGMDGELFIRFFVGKEEENSAGQLVMAPLRPWEIAWIHTEKGFFKRPLSYHFQPYTTYNTDDPDNGGAADIEDIPADQLLHVAINKSTYELRGRPELYAALPWLKAYKDWLENRARQNHWRGAMLWWVKIAAQAQVIAQKIAQYARTNIRQYCRHHRQGAVECPLQPGRRGGCQRRWQADQADGDGGHVGHPRVHGRRR